MKKFKEIFGLILALILSYSAIAKANHYPGGGFGLVVSLGILMFPYLVIVGIDLYRKYGTNLTFLILTGLSTIIYSVGFLFFILHWPGGFLFSFFGLVFLLLTLFISSIIELFKKEEKRNLSITIMTFMIISVSLIFVSSQRTVTKNVLTGYIQTNDKLLLIEDKLKNDNLQGYAEVGDTLMQFRKVNDDLISFIDDIKKELIIKVNGSSESFEISAIKSKDNIDIPNQVMFAEQKARYLRLSIDKYKSIAFSLLPSETFKSVTEVQVLNTQDPAPIDGDLISWESSQFENLPIVAVINNLTSIQLGIRLCESNVIRFYRQK
jgi:hypothetical protein